MSSHRITATMDGVQPNMLSWLWFAGRSGSALLASPGCQSESCLSGTWTGDVNCKRQVSTLGLGDDGSLKIHQDPELNLMGFLQGKGADKIQQIQRLR